MHGRGKIACLQRRYNLQGEVYEEMIRKLLSNVLLLSKTFILMVGVFFRLW